LDNGPGFWLKFPAEMPRQFDGELVTADTIPVKAGWNMIGAVSVPLAAVDIESTPAGIVTSHFYTYQSRYLVDDTLRPGNAYWVHADANGALILAPLPPGSVPGSTKRNSAIQIAEISSEPPPPPSDVASGQEGFPMSYHLGQNYPNPFNPTTTIQYQLPQDARVTLKVYDILGSEVATLVNEEQQAGYREVQFNGISYASGMYVYRLTAGKYVSTKKMMVVK